MGRLPGSPEAVYRLGEGKAVEEPAKLLVLSRDEPGLGPVDEATLDIDAQRGGLYVLGLNMGGEPPPGGAENHRLPGGASRPRRRTGAYATSLAIRKAAPAATPPMRMVWMPPRRGLRPIILFLP